MNAPLAVTFQRRASRDIDQIATWWSTNRPVAPDLFLAELEQMLAAVALMPTLGAQARSRRARGVRRILLPRTRYHLYYRVRDGAIEVLAVWHAKRGSGAGV